MPTCPHCNTQFDAAPENDSKDAIMIDMLERGIAILRTQYLSDMVYTWLRDARELLEILRASQTTR